VNSDSFFEKAARLDALLERGHPLEVIDEVVELLQEAPLHEYFFGRLDRPEWLTPLKERGYFDDPPQPIVVEGRVRFPSWPQGRYLVRIAEAASDAVLDIALGLPETANVRVHQHLVEAALSMPAQLSAKLVPRTRQWLEMLEVPSQLIIPDTLGQLLDHLTEGGQVEAALDLARELLFLRAEDRSVGEFTFTDPHPRFDVWDYQALLKENIPKLVSADGEKALSLLCDTLEDAARISQRAYGFDRSKSHPYEDGFYVQRPAIEDHAQNEPHGLIDALITAVRDATERLIAEDKASVPGLVVMLERRGWQVFDRLALHLLWRFPEAAPDLIAERLIDRRRFDDSGLRHEYALLARKRFATLEASDKQTILAWIDDGPDLERFRQRREAFGEAPPTKDEELRYADTWRRDCLALLEDGLPWRWRRRYRELVHRLGEAEHPEFASYTRAVRAGSTSPVTSDDLRSMSVDEFFRHLRSWRPSGDLMSPSYEGLGRELTSVVASDPEPFAAASLGFRGLDPTYVRAFFYGLRDATKQGRVFAWPSVLNLSRWVLTQAREIRGHEPEHEAHEALHDRDLDWGETRKAIAYLLSEGLETTTRARLHLDLHSRIWDVLAPLTQDEEPTPEYEERYGESNMDPVTLSINTVRRQAMHTVVRYAVWVREEREAVGEGQNVAAWFHEIPEAREILDHRLDPQVEPSTAVRAVYGQWFPYLVWLDNWWATHSVRRIFPPEPKYRALRAAAWGALVTFTRPHLETFEILKDEYRRSVQQLRASPSGKWMSAEPDERLAEHLMVLYWWGALGVEGRDDLLPLFFANAPDELRAHALDFVGLSLHRTGADVPLDTLNRLRELWDRRLNPSDREPVLSGQEAAAFGWWFASAKFDDAWSMEQLKVALTRTSDLDAYDLVLERLAALSDRMPADAVDCLKLLLDRDVGGWRTVTYLSTQERILRAALRSEDLRAQRTAESLINRLGAKGQWDLGVLLREAENGTTY